MDEMFTAERGQGAFLNDRRIRVSARRSLENAVVVTGIPHRGRPGHERFLGEIRDVMAACAGVRRYGAAALDLAWVAAGRFDGYWERDISAWDMAAGILLVREAGGLVSDAVGGQKMFQTGAIVAANSGIQRSLVDMLAKAGK